MSRQIELIQAVIIFAVLVMIVAGSIKLQSCCPVQGRLLSRVPVIGGW